MGKTPNFLFFCGPTPAIDLRGRSGISRDQAVDILCSLSSVCKKKKEKEKKGSKRIFFFRDRVISEYFAIIGSGVKTIHIYAHAPTPVGPPCVNARRPRMGGAGRLVGRIGHFAPTNLASA